MLPASRRKPRPAFAEAMADRPARPASRRIGTEHYVGKRQERRIYPAVRGSGLPAIYHQLPRYKPTPALELHVVYGTSLARQASFPITHHASRFTHHFPLVKEQPQVRPRALAGSRLSTTNSPHYPPS